MMIKFIAKMLAKKMIKNQLDKNLKGNLDAAITGKLQKPIDVLEGLKIYLFFMAITMIVLLIGIPIIVYSLSSSVIAIVLTVLILIVYFIIFTIKVFKRFLHELAIESKRAVSDLMSTVIGNAEDGATINRGTMGDIISKLKKEME